MAEKLDPVISAVAAVHSALKDLDPEERDRVLASVRALLGLSPPEPVASTSGSSEQVARSSAAIAPKPARRLSLIELMQDKLPSTNAQKIALFAYYRDRFESKPRFARDDLKAYFAMAKESPPANYDRDFVNAARSGWVHEEDGDSYVTSKGIEVVESGFVGERKSTRKKNPGRKTTRKPAGARSRKKSTRKR